MKRGFGGALVALALATLLLGGCANFNTAFSIGYGSSVSQAPGARPLPPMQNNLELRLEPVVYSGGEIIHNSVQISGAGPNRTVIKGDLIIRGNNVVLRGMRLAGDVYLMGNNIALVAVEVDGVVQSSGRNNRW